MNINNDRAPLIAKYLKIPTVFRRALPTKPYRTGGRGIFKGGCPPFNPGFEGAEPLAAFGIFRASGCPEMHTLA